MSKFNSAPICICAPPPPYVVGLISYHTYVVIYACDVCVGVEEGRDGGSADRPLLDGDGKPEVGASVPGSGEN